MEWFKNIIRITGDHISTLLNTIRLGITGTTYGDLPQTAVTNITDTTAVSKVPRFVSHATNPSYELLYEDTYSYNENNPDLKRKNKNDKNDKNDKNAVDGFKSRKKGNVKDYVKDLDASQAVFIVIKESRSKYVVHLLFTRDTRIKFLRGKIPTILLRVLYLEQFKYGSTPPESYICIGTVDANNNRDQKQTAFHQDNFPSYFISDPLERIFSDTIQIFFPERPHYPQCGFLDFQTLITHLAVTTGRDKTHELFSLLRGAVGQFAPFFAYLNSIITHATPDYINMDEIIAYYNNIGKQVPQEVEEFVEKFNKYLTILRENKREFRRCLVSFADYNIVNLIKANETILQFYTNATATIEEDIITKNLNDYLLKSPIYSPNIDRLLLFNNNQFLNDPDRINVDKFVYMRKTFIMEDTSNNNQNNPNLNYLIELKNKMFVPIEDTRLLVGRDNHEAVLVSDDAMLVSEKGGSKTRQKRNKRRNTKKRQNLKKGKRRRTNKKKHNRRTKKR